MAQGTEIIVTAEPRGNFLEGIVSGTPKPGTVMQVSAAVEPQSGAFTWVVYNRDADGNRPAGPIAVLLPDRLQGGLETAAYTTGSRCYLYCPLPGDLLNMLFANVAGTSDTFAIGDIMIVDDGTGKLIATTGSVETEPFVCMETVSTALTADTLTLAMFSGF